LTRAREYIEAAQIAAGIKPLRRIYDLRHTFATFALRAVFGAVSFVTG
jgi:integrase